MRHPNRRLGAPETAEPSKSSSAATTPHLRDAVPLLRRNEARIPEGRPPGEGIAGVAAKAPGIGQARNDYRDSNTNRASREQEHGIGFGPSRGMGR